MSTGGGGITHVLHRRRTPMDPGIFTMPGRSSSGFHGPDRRFFVAASVRRREEGLRGGGGSGGGVVAVVAAVFCEVDVGVLMLYVVVGSWYCCSLFWV